MIAVGVAPVNADGIPTAPHLPPSSFTQHLSLGYYSMSWLLDGAHHASTVEMPPQPAFTNAFSRERMAEFSDKSNAYAILVFPLCAASTDSRCLQDIRYQESNQSEWKSARSLGYLPVTVLPSIDPTRQRYVEWAQEDLDLRANEFIPSNSARSSLWQIEHDGKTKILLATATTFYDPVFTRYQSFKLTLTPVRQVFVSEPSAYQDMNPQATWCARTGYPDSFFQNNNFHPLETSHPQLGFYDYCLIKDEFPDNVKYQVAIQLSPDLRELAFDNWVASRSTQTRAFVSVPTKTNSPVATFEGLPVDVQSAVTQVPHTEEGFEAFYSGNSDLQAYVKSGQISKESARNNFGIGPNYSGGQANWSYGWQAIELWRATEKYVDPTLTRQERMWVFSLVSLSMSEGDWIPKCQSQSRGLRNFSGVVSTNATVFVQGTPILTTDGSLEFRVAATHLKENGEKNLGSYNLSIPLVLAKCLWGQDLSPSSLTLSVVQENGQTQIATSTIKHSNSQVHFNAEGFHYSINSLKVGLKAPAKVNQPTSNASDAKFPIKKKTITCKNGKLVKKVTGTSPACPKGFKKVT